MPRTGRRRSLSIAAVAITMLAAPAAAQAATYTVKAGGGTCGGGDLACESLAAAAAAAAPGDVFNVSPGTYASATFAVGGVTIAGAPNFSVAGTLTFSADAGGVSKLQKAVIGQTSASPALVASGAAGLEVSDSGVASAGDAAVFSEGTANRVVRSVFVTTGGTAAAVRVTSADLSSAAKALTMESTLVTGGAAGLSVNTGSGGPASTAGDIAVKLRHVTAAGSANGLRLDASQAVVAVGGPVGNITADVENSIIENATAKAVFPGVLNLPLLPVLAPPNTVTDTYDVQTLRTFDPNAVFVNPARRNFRLRAGSPAIGVGGVTAGESATDFEGQDRATAPTDLGFDEFVAAPPTGPPPSPVPPVATGDGAPPVIVITKPKANQRIKLTKTTTRTVTVTRNGKRTRVKRRTTKRTKIGFAGTATDKSGVKGVIVTLERLSVTASTPKTAAKSSAATAPTKKCRWFSATKGIVLKSCAKPVLLLAKLATDGTWTYNIKSTVRLKAGVYRLSAAGADKGGVFGNAAPSKDSVHRFTLVK